ncbi:MAG: DUF3820 family protein [Bacteroidales bacterium]|nr:DUF3820 family protein [Bacteroidales bacterium]
MSEKSPNPEILFQLVKMEMPFGKYKGYKICDLPEYYLVWFKQKGFPAGKLGMLLETMYEIKLNGLEYLLKPLKKY